MRLREEELGRHWKAWQNGCNYLNGSGIATHVSMNVFRVYELRDLTFLS